MTDPPIPYLPGVRRPTVWQTPLTVSAAVHPSVGLSVAGLLVPLRGLGRTRPSPSPQMVVYKAPRRYDVVRGPTGDKITPYCNSINLLILFDHKRV